MDGEAAADVKYLHLSSRLNRLRYFSYSVAMSWVSIPIYMLSTYFTLHRANLMGGLLYFASSVFFVPIHFTFIIRRLHDLDRSGWWSLTYGAMLPFFFLAALGIRTPPLSGVMLLLGLVNIGFFLMLLFTPGIPQQNRFGLPPPPNGPLVVAGAWSALPLMLFIIIANTVMIASLAGSASRNNYALTIAKMGAEQARLYREENHEWPTNLSAASGGSLTEGRPYQVSTIKYPDGSYGIIVAGTTDLTRGNGVEVWTADSGATWHCGPAYSSTLSKDDLPDNCREDAPPIP